MAAHSRLILTFQNSSFIGCFNRLRITKPSNIKSLNIHIRLLYASEVKNKGDKFNLTNSTRKKRRFKSVNPRNTSDPNKLEIFRLDPQYDVKENIFETRNTRKQAFSTTLHDAMTNLLTSVDIDEELLNYNIKITHVQVSKDMAHVTFNWTIDNKDQIKDVTEILERNKNNLRLLLGSYHYLNITPRVAFTYDKYAEYLANVESLLDANAQESHS